MTKKFSKQGLATLAILVANLAITACTGVPLRSVPRLMQLNQQLLEANPAEFMVALQVDARMVPPRNASLLAEAILLNINKPRDPAQLSRQTHERFGANALAARLDALFQTL